MLDTALARLPAASRTNIRSVLASLTPVKAVFPLLALLVFTFAFRSIHFGSPDVDFDEPFYLLVGDQMVHGKLPYIDIWDRKPVGLFVIYAAIRLLGGAGFTEYLVVAALFAFATATFIWVIARRWLSAWQALLPAVTYIVWLEPYKGGGGQTAIFYNLFMVAAFYLLLRARDHAQPAMTVLFGAAAMMLVGISIQVKYTVLPEGMFFGLGFLWLLWNQTGKQLGNWPRLVLIGAGLAVLALLPTVLVTAWYWHLGQLDTFVYANFTSLFQRGRLQPYYIRENLTYIQIVGLPLTATAVFGLGRLMRGDAASKSDFPWVLGWVLASLIGFLMIGNFYYYYFMPMLVTLSIASAANLRERQWGSFLFFMLLLWPFMIRLIPSADEDQRRVVSIQRLTDSITPHIDANHCLYVFDGPTALYLTTKSCLPTRFVYPDHLTNDVERPALGVDATVELRRVLAKQPGVIVTGAPKLVPVLNAANVALMQQALARDYYPIAQVGHSWRLITVWGRKHGPGSSDRNNAWHPSRPIQLYPPERRWHDQLRKS